MALGPYYIDGSIGGTGGAGTVGDPFRSWADFLTVAGSLGGHGEVIVYMKNKCTTGDANGVFTAVAWTDSSATNYLHFQPWSGFEGDGTLANTPGWVSATNAYFSVVVVPQHTKITRLGSENTATGLGRGGVRSNAGKLICDGVISKAEDAGFDYGAESVLTNCISITAGGVGFATSDSYTTYTLTNCTAITTVASGTAFNTAGLGRTTTCRNCVAYGSWTTEWSASGTWHADSTNNAGQLAVGSQPTNIQTGYVPLTAMPFTALAQPYRPATGGQLDNAGTTTGAPATDGVGTTRGSPPDIGWLEAATAPPSGPLMGQIIL